MTAPADPDGAPGRRGVVDRVVGSYWNFSGAMRGLLAERPSEASLAGFLALAAFFIFLGEAGVLYALAARAPEGGEEGAAYLARISLTLVVTMSVTMFFAYAVAALTRVALLPLGGTGSWYESRAAVIWALLVGAPAMLVSRGLTIATISGAPPEMSLVALEDPTARALADPPVTLALAAASEALQLLALFILVVCVAAAHGFSRGRLAAGLAVAVAAGATVFRIASETAS